jgi:hypothetical protein
MRRLLWLFVGVLTLAAMASAAPQRGFGRRTAMAPNLPWVYDGDFVFCRLAFSESRDGDGGGWSVDYPRADLNFPFRLGELTSARISHDARGDANHVVVTPTDPHLFQCPFVMMTEPGRAYFSDEDAAALRQYLEKGGFLWADDFWGEYAWAIWEREIRKVMPASEYPIFDVPMSHPIFNMKYLIHKIPQIPSITFWFGSGFQTSERYADSAVPHVRAIENAQGHIIVLMTHNTDFGDAWEREGDDRRYFDTFASAGYAFGVNVFMYAMTH